MTIAVDVVAVGETLPVI